MLFKNLFESTLFKEYLKTKKNLAQTTLHAWITTIDNFLSEQEDLENIESYNNYIIDHAIKKRSTYVYSVLKSFIQYYIQDAGKRASMIENLIKPEIS